MTSRELRQSRVVFPGPDLRAPTAFSLAVPDGWVLSEVPLALVAIHPPEPVDGFWVHALVSTTRVAAEVDLRAVAASGLERLRREQPEADVRVERMGRFGDQPVHLRGLTLPTGSPPRPTSQLQALLRAPVTPGRAVTDLVTVVGSCPEARSDEFVPRFIDLVASIEFGLGDPPIPGA
ncbi:MAG TPA: hypothetical protein VK866_11305 [Acidimicrobiales bacterium]|nr:hypothetical protein [Acidimicrobiales bacterium]